MKHTRIITALLSATVLPSVAQSRPNVIYIIMDDLGYGDLGCYGQQLIETPNIDRLRTEGMKFTSHYSGSPVSGPSRCVLMTGMHSGHAQIRHNNEMASRGAVNDHDSMYVHPYLEGQAPLRAGTMTLGRMMQQAGYTTGCFGKWGLGYPGSEGEPLKQGFDRFYGYNCQRQAHTHYPPFLYSDSSRVMLRNSVFNPHSMRLAKDDNPLDTASYSRFYQTDYAHDLIFGSLMDFVDANRSRPFFIMWTTPLPHVSLMAPKEWVDYYVDKFGDEEPYLGRAGYAACRYPHATYAAMISYFDSQVGQLVDKLKEQGLYDNTLIIFTSDNGPTFNGGSDSPWFASGGPFRSEYGWGKCFLHEGGIRVPHIAVWPGHIAPGSESDHISCFQDVMPTLVEAIGIASPPTDGISYLPVLTGHPERQGTHEYLYWEYPDPNIGNAAVRMGRWKGIITDMNRGNTSMQLYDLATDSVEATDISAAHPDIVAQLKAIMDQEHTAYTPAR
ncbi:MAG: arylsulfatase [Muribaculaceae bacterium]|nr:arylsulfatase [Muribaculaceae bacterium]